VKRVQVGWRWGRGGEPASTTTGPDRCGRGRDLTAGENRRSWMAAWKIIGRDACDVSGGHVAWRVGMSQLCDVLPEASGALLGSRLGSSDATTMLIWTVLRDKAARGNKTHAIGPQIWWGRRCRRPGPGPVRPKQARLGFFSAFQGTQGVVFVVDSPVGGGMLIDALFCRICTRQASRDGVRRPIHLP